MRKRNLKWKSLRIIFIWIMILFPVLVMNEPFSHAKAATGETDIPVEKDPQLFLNRSMPTHGDAKIAVFLIDFPDYKNENPLATVKYYDGLYFSGGTDTNWDEYVDSVSDFYNKESYGKLKISGQVFDWYTAKHERSYYDDPIKKAELIREAGEYYRALGTDFSQFDGDNDGIIDTVVFHFAGEASSVDMDDPWYDGVTFSGVGSSIGDMKFYGVVQIYEGAIASFCKMIDTICHELLHALGMPDLYGKVWRMDAANDLMGATTDLFINPYFKLLLGWIDMDSVTIITKDTSDIRLALYGNELYGGATKPEIAIVTDEYNGLYDEFYLVVYRQLYQFITPVIYHIDARLNEEGTAFAYNNLYYDPRPDKGNAHRDDTVSTYMFMEELSADATVNYVLLNRPYSPEVTGFCSDSVFGPNSFPSSDKHDGGYTGIRIDGFEEHKEEYMTFNVSFVKDTTAPVLTTSADDLEFKQIITIRFNEYIYKGKKWDDILVTDLEGNAIDATIVLPHYPRHEIEISFQEDSYKDGYQIVFPADAVRDSSGNALYAVTLVASKDGLLPISETQLPGTGDHLRFNTSAGVFFFAHEEDFVVITRLFGAYTEGESDGVLYSSDAKIEFMRLDYEGNVLKQTIVDNPFGGSEIVSVMETDDDSYIFLCRILPSYNNDLLFCVDSKGKLKWSNDECYNTGTSFFGRKVLGNFKQEQGIVITDNKNKELVHISSKTGEIKEITFGSVPSSFFVYNQFFDISDESIVLTQRGMIGEKLCTNLKLYDKKTGELRIEGYIEATDGVRYEPEEIHANSDGTFFVKCNHNGKRYVFLLNCELKEVKKVELFPLASGNEFYWIAEDGFCDINRTRAESHDNSQFQIRRYDRYLNLVWESDVISNFIYYFKSSSDEIMAYKSMSVPERECYIENYGSEDSRKQEHSHSLVYYKGTASTCTSQGTAEYWYCTDCGGSYLDKGKTPLLDIQSLSLSFGGHTKEILAAVKPTCTVSGLTEGVYCVVCKKVLTEQETVKPTGHSYKKEVVSNEYKAKDATCTSPAAYYMSCECGAKGTETFYVGEKDTSIHTKETFIYVNNGGTHTKKNECCGTIVLSEEVHSYDVDGKCMCGAEKQNDMISTPEAAPTTSSETAPETESTTASATVPETEPTTASATAPETEPTTASEAVPETESTTFPAATSGDGTKVPSKTDSKGSEESSFPWWIIVSIAVVLGGGGAVVFFVRKK